MGRRGKMKRRRGKNEGDWGKKMEWRRVKIRKREMEK